MSFQIPLLPSRSKSSLQMLLVLLGTTASALAQNPPEQDPPEPPAEEPAPPAEAPDAGENAGESEEQPAEPDTADPDPDDGDGATGSEESPEGTEPELVEPVAIEPDPAPTEPEPAPQEPEEAPPASTEEPPPVLPKAEAYEDEIEIVVGAGAPEDEVIIAGTRRAQLSGAIQVIGEEQLERTEYDDPHAVLRQVPGVFVREEDGTGLRPNIAMRGVNPDRSKKVTLLEDGILFGPAPYSAPAAYYFPMMTRMTQVRVIKGPGAIAYGPQTVAGAVDLTTRRIPVDPTLAADVALGQYGYRKVHAYAGASNEQFGLLIEGVHMGHGGFKELPSGLNTGAAQNEWMVKGSYLVDPTAKVSHEFSMKLGYSDEASNETYLGLTEADFLENPDRRYPASELDRMDNHRTHVSLTHDVNDYERSLRVLTTVYRNDFSRVWNKFNRLGGADAGSVLSTSEDPENASYYGVLTGQSNSSGAFDTLFIGPNQREYVSQGLSTRLQWNPKGKLVLHKLEAGLRLHHDSIERDQSERGYFMGDGELYPTPDADIQTALNRDSSHAAALHLADAISLYDLTVTPGVRIEGIYSTHEDRLMDEKTERTVLAVMPGLGIYYGLTKDWGVLAGVYRGFSPPAPGSDDEVRPELSVNYELGTRFSRKKTRAELVGFFNDYSNLTDICTFSSGCLDQNLDRQFDAGRANVYGLEASASHDLVVEKLTFPFSLAYTLNFGEFESDFVSADPVYGTVEAGDEVPYLPRHQLNAMVGFEVGRFAAYTVFNYVAATREGAGSEPLNQVMSTDPLLQFDAGASAQVHKSVKIYANGRNLADYRAIVAHRPYGARPNAPRWIQAGVKAEF